MSCTCPAESCRESVRRCWPAPEYATLQTSVISSTDERSKHWYDQVRLLRGNQDWVEKWESGRSLQLAGSQLGEYKRLCEVVMMCYSEQMKLLLVALV